MEVRVQENQIEKALRDLKRKLAKEGVMRELKAKRFFEKPSVKKKRKQKEAQKRRNKTSFRPSFS